ncbi:pilin N-terminal domain-containing protein [Lactococcus petauri]|uniref:pilin N-terminal domain-containing protein n=1 Tax=Lactococcus petauri TaxID=1940789 RepID=UPI00255146BA|nr:pilin N-terminal domain-containing protein [Lactococcus petauri]
MKNKVLKYILLSIFTFLMVFFLNFDFTSVAASEVKNDKSYSINIVKYKLSDTQLSQTVLPHDPVGIPLEEDKLKDSNGNNLVGMHGIRYQIDKVVPSNDNNNPFEVAPDNKSQVIATDINGKCSVILSTGIYRVTELPGNGIEQEAEPVIVQLPLYLQNGKILKDVYIYPKSSMGTDNLVSNDFIDTYEPNKIPDTAENIDSLYAVYGILITVVLLGLYGLFIKPKKFLLKNKN